jgi:nucleoside-diphosphate-sugar epimerase
MVRADDLKTVLIAGASGVIGSAAVERFAREDWRVIALSRQAPIVATDVPYHHLPLDLTDPEQCRAALTPIVVDELVYAAASEASGLVGGWRDEDRMALNGRMFANVLEPLAARGTLRHVSIMQGAKAYGAHLHPVEVPLREDSKRDPHPNFYWLHEDLLRSTALVAGFGFTIWRPQILIGFAPRAAMNPVAAIGAYAAICREAGLPFALPGAGEALLELVDADLLAEALIWSATADSARNQTFNVTNGDQFVLRHVWPAVAEAFELPAEGPAPESCVAFFASVENRSAWDRLAERYALQVPALATFLGQSHHYLDLLNSARVAAKAHPTLLSTIKLRQAGFAPCRDSRDALLHQLRRMAELRLLPPLG